jgi:HNH endonuclease
MEGVVTMLTAERLRELMTYHPETGMFTYLVTRSPRALAGMHVAGSLNAVGYFVITIDRRHYTAHRLAWLWMTGEWPKHEIDHIDEVRTNNVWSNLRDVTRRLNLLNRRNVGPWFDKSRGQWQLRVGRMHVGRFPTREAALAARNAVIEAEFGEFATL